MTSNKDFLKILVNNSIERQESFKVLLEAIHKNKEVKYPDWYKDFLRDCLSMDKQHVKQYQEELTHFNAGMNPPYMYN